MPEKNSILSYTLSRKREEVWESIMQFAYAVECVDNQLLYNSLISSQSSTFANSKPELCCSVTWVVRYNVSSLFDTVELYTVLAYKFKTFFLSLILSVTTSSHNITAVCRLYNLARTPYKWIELTIITCVRTLFWRLFDGQNIRHISWKLFSSCSSFLFFFLLLLAVILTINDDVRNRCSATRVQRITFFGAEFSFSSTRKFNTRRQVNRCFFQSKSLCGLQFLWVLSSIIIITELNQQFCRAAHAGPSAAQTQPWSWRFPYRGSSREIQLQKCILGGLCSEEWKWCCEMWGLVSCSGLTVVIMIIIHMSILP